MNAEFTIPAGRMPLAIAVVEALTVTVTARAASAATTLASVEGPPEAVAVDPLERWNN